MVSSICFFKLFSSALTRKHTGTLFCTVKLTPSEGDAAHLPFLILDYFSPFFTCQLMHLDDSFYQT